MAVEVHLVEEGGGGEDLAQPGQHVREAKVLVVLRSGDQLQERLQPHDELIGRSVLGADHARVHRVGPPDNVSRLADPCPQR